MALRDVPFAILVMAWFGGIAVASTATHFLNVALAGRLRDTRLACYPIGSGIVLLASVACFLMYAHVRPDRDAFWWYWVSNTLVCAFSGGAVFFNRRTDRLAQRAPGTRE